MDGDTAVTAVQEGDLLWTPSAQRIAESNLARFMTWLADHRGQVFVGYHDLWRWSVEDLEGFWQAIWDYFAIDASAPPSAVLADRRMPGARWFPDARLNYAQHVLRAGRPDSDAVLFASETAALSGLSWDDLAAAVRILATRLRDLGVGVGDRVVAYLPNVPQAIVAMLATTSVGAVWASCSPDFGWRGAQDRFAQLQPTVLFTVDGYRYGGRTFDRRAEVRQLAAAMPTLHHVIHLPQLDSDDPTPVVEGAVPWGELMDHPPVPPEAFAFEQVAFDHPLWILFSSGTTGLPKAIVHGHGGILLEQLKLQHLLMDVRPGDRTLFFTTTGWMMWNFLVSTLLVGATPVLYDGNPTHPRPDVLWRLAQDSGATLFGASPSYVELMERHGVVPGQRYDLTQLRTIMPAGSPVSPEKTAWFYRNVNPDVWVATGSGGTDVCTGFVGGVPTLPVRAGEIQARSLGVDVHAFDGQGHPVVDQVGELVITQPMPSMPVHLWGDEGFTRYTETYFADHPGVWRHGDFFRLNRRGGCFVLGRSDATLNRHGVRIGTAEIYRALEALEEVDDALVVNLDLPGGAFFMPLFITLADGQQLDDELAQRIRDHLRRTYTPRHVPDRIVAVPEIPRTLTGKTMEVPVRRILMGVAPEQAANRNAMANPASLDIYVDYARSQQDYSLD